MDQPMTMDYMRGWMMDNWLAFSGAGILILVLLVIYYVFLVRAVLDMLRDNPEFQSLVERIRSENAAQLAESGHYLGHS